MKSTIQSFFPFLICLLVGCGGGGGGTGTSGTPVKIWTHEELAKEFVEHLDRHVYGYDLTIVKTNTLQTGFVVVFNEFSGDYEAYDLRGYGHYTDPEQYLKDNAWTFYYGLVPEAGNNYRDQASGKLFEVDSSATMDLDQMAAVEEMIALHQLSRGLRKNYGMNEYTAKSLARYQIDLSKQQPGSFDKARFDQFTKSLTGSSYTEVLEDQKAGRTESLKERWARAQAKTGMRDNGLQKLMMELFE